MFRAVALSGASAMTIEMALLAPFNVAFAQSNSLPSVTIESPKVVAMRVARKPGQRTAALTRRTPKPAAVPPPARPVVVFVNTDSGGVNASFGTPPVVARFQLPQESYSITSRQIDETINLKIGNAFDVVCERKQTDFEKIASACASVRHLIGLSLLTKTASASTDVRIGVGL